MGILLNLLTLPVLGPIRGVVWVGKELGNQAERELYDDDAVRSELLALEEKLDLGEISEEEYREQEGALLQRLNAIREFKEAS